LLSFGAAPQNYEMARRRMDKQILWVVVFAAAFWLAIWNHDAVMHWIRKTPNLLQWIQQALG